jgi:hypothetical protein
VFIGATSILSAVLPVFQSFKVLTAAGTLTTYGRLLALDGGLCLVGGAGELYRGNALGGGLMLFGGVTGLLWLHSGVVAGSSMCRVPATITERELVERITLNNPGRVPAIDPVIEPASRVLRNQYQDLGMNSCSISSLTMIFEAFGMEINIGMQAHMGRVAYFNRFYGTIPSYAHKVADLFLPNARFWDRGTMTVRQLERAVMNGHPVHLSVFNPGTRGHTIVVDGLERSWLGAVRFLLRDPDPGVHGMPAYGRTVSARAFASDLRHAEVITTNPQSWVNAW